MTPSVFPWTAESPLVLGIVVLALALYTVVVIVGHSKLRQRLLAQEPAGVLARIPRRARGLLARTTFWIVVLGTTYVALYAWTWVWPEFAVGAFAFALERLPAALALLGIFVGAALLLETVQGLTDGEGAAAARIERRLTPQGTRALGLFLRYAIFATSGVAGVLTLLDALGFQGRVGTRVGEWFAAQAGAMLLILVLIGIGWAGGRITRAVTSDVRRTSRRLRPQVVDALGAAARGALYTVLTLIGVFTILSAVGLGSVGGTLVVVMSSFVGLVVAMAATGSIGNALSGAVLLGFRPYSPGERVVLLDDLTGDIEEVTLMFTNVRTLAGEVVEIPNNLVLSKRVKNLSRSRTHAIVVKLGIGYDVSHDLVRRLAVGAAARTEGIVTEPAPGCYARDFGNYAISYELYAYTKEPRHLKLRSELLGHLQEDFYAAGVEIMTPDVMVMRRGKLAEPEGAVRVRVDEATPVGESVRE